MKLLNRTTFTAMSFMSLAPDGTAFQTVVVKAAYRIVDFARLEPAPDLQDIVMADRYAGDPTSSSIAMPNDLAPFKPKADVHLVGTARASSGRPAASWFVVLRVGERTKALRVTGPRRWERSLLGWQLTEPVPTLEVPLRYEQAYGGVFRKGEEVGFCEHNPIGRGFVLRSVDSDDGPIEAPQIEDPRHPIEHLSEEYVPQGFGPIPGAWRPRRNHIGTTDDAWIREKAPLHPDDFSYAFYNTAPADLQWDGFLDGTLPIAVSGVHPERHIGCTLDVPALLAAGRFSLGEEATALLRADSLTIDTDELAVLLTWRAVLPRPERGSLDALLVRALEPSERAQLLENAEVLEQRSVR